jgi:hypothetical protein
MPGMPNRWSFEFKAFARTFEARQTQYQRVLFRAAFLKVEHELRLFRGILRFTRDQDPLGEKKTPENMDCGALLLTQEYLGVDVGYYMVEKGRNKRVPLKPSNRFMGPFAMESAGVSVLTGAPMPAEMRGAADWPFYAFNFLPMKKHKLTLPEGRVPEPCPMAGQSWADVVDWWVGSDSEYGRGNNDSYLYVVLPDFRARIAGIEYSGGDFFVEAEEMLLSRDRVLLSHKLGPPSFLRSYRETKFHGKRYLTPDPEFEQPAIHVELRDRQTNDLIDWAMLSSEWNYRNPEVKKSPPGKRIANALRIGENDRIEFKREVGNGDELLESICSFANAGGGSVFLGVDDDCNPTGVDTKREEQRIRDFVQQKCDPPVRVEFEAVQYAGKELLIVHVPEGTNPPYLFRPKGVVYIRYGSSDRPANRADLDLLYHIRSRRTTSLNSDHKRDRVS